MARARHHARTLRGTSFSRTLLQRTSALGTMEGHTDFRSVVRTGACLDLPAAAYDGTRTAVRLWGVAQPFHLLHHADARNKQRPDRHVCVLANADGPVESTGSDYGALGPDARRFGRNPGRLMAAASTREKSSERVLKLRGVLRRGILAAAKAARTEHPRSGL